MLLPSPSEDTPYRMWFGEADLELFFEMAEKRTGG